MRKVISAIGGILLVSSLALMCFLVLGNVVLRYVFNSGITWAEEFSRFLFIFVTFFGAVYAMAKNEHLKVEMFIKNYSERVRTILNLVVNVIVLIAMLLLLKGSWEITLVGVETRAPATGIQMSYVYGIVLLASIGMIVITLRNIINIFLKKKPSTDNGET